MSLRAPERASRQDIAPYRALAASVVPRGRYGRPVDSTSLMAVRHEGSAVASSASSLIAEAGGDEAAFW
jgi:hypothetical protein